MNSLLARFRYINDEILCFQWKRNKFLFELPSEIDFPFLAVEFLSEILFKFSTTKWLDAWKKNMGKKCCWFSYKQTHTKIKWIALKASMNYDTHSWILFWSSSKIGPVKSLIMKYVIHSRSDNFSIPVSDISTGTPKLSASVMVSGSSATAPIKHIRFFDVVSGKI